MAKKEIEEVKDEEVKKTTKKAAKAEKEEKVEKIEEVKDDIDCDGNCESCEIDCLGDYEFEPVHKKASVANIFSIICKIAAILFLIIGTYEFVLSVMNYASSYGETPAFLEVVYSWFADVMQGAVVFFGIGELINIINRIKESIMY